MTNLRSLTVSATAALLLFAVTSCADGGSDPPSTKSTPSTSPPQSSPTSDSAPATGDSAAAAQAAESIVRDYFAVVDHLRQEPATPLNELTDVATSTQLEAQRRLMGGERTKELRQQGNTNIVELKVQSVNLDNADPDAGKAPTVTIDVCWDVSNVDIVDSSGESVVPPDRPTTGWTRYTVANYDWAEDPSSGWRIATGQDLRQAPCAAS